MVVTPGRCAESSLPQSVTFGTSYVIPLTAPEQTREALVSGSIGRPQHCSDEACDIAPLEMSDFVDLTTLTKQVDAAYACSMARLSRISERPPLPPSLTTVVCR